MRRIITAVHVNRRPAEGLALHASQTIVARTVQRMVRPYMRTAVGTEPMVRYVAEKRKAASLQFRVTCQASHVNKTSVGMLIATGKSFAAVSESPKIYSQDRC